MIFYMCHPDPQVRFTALQIIDSLAALFQPKPGVEKYVFSFFFFSF
jgi:hypothetical protein